MIFQRNYKNINDFSKKSQKKSMIFQRNHKTNQWFFKEVNLILACLFDLAFHGAGLLPRCRLSDRFLISSPIKLPHASSSGPTRILSHSRIPPGRILYHFPHLRGFPLGMRHLFIATGPYFAKFHNSTTDRKLSPSCEQPNIAK